MKKFWLFAFAAYFVSRFINLTSIPIFTDEAIYLRWSQIMSGDLHYLYLPLTDGKPPLFMWLGALGMKIAPMVDPLFVGRATAVLLGVFGLTGIYFTSYQLFKSKFVSKIAVLFYLISPFTFFYDRFNLADSLLAAIGTWSLGLGVILVRKLSLKIAIILGVVVGLGLWTKSPALEFVLLLPALVLLLDFTARNWKKQAIHYAVLLGVVFVVSRVVYEVLFLLPQAYVINLKNLEFVIPVSQFIQNPFIFVAGNLNAMTLWLTTYLTWPLVFVVVISTLYGVKQRSIPKLILLGYFFAHFFFMVFFNKVIYARFLLMFFPLILIMAAKGIEDLSGVLKNKFLLATLIIVVSLVPIFADWKISFDPINAPIADNDSAQYINGQPAGYGINEVRDFLALEASKNEKITLGMEGTFGLLPYALELYHSQYPNLIEKPIWPEPDTLPKDIAQAAKEMPTYYIVYQRSTTPFENQLQLIGKYRQGNSNSYLKLYKVIPGR